jgi:hypothetical protein
MITVDKPTFERVIAKFSVTKEFEQDVEYGYDTFADETGEMLGLVSYHAHKGDTYGLYGAADALLRDELGLPHSADLGDKVYATETVNG